MKTLFVGITGLALGAGLGWMGRSGEVSELRSKAEISEDSAKRSSAELQARTISREQQAQAASRYAEFRALKGDSHSNREKFMESLSAQELYSMLGSISEGAGITGLEYDERREAEDLVKRMYEEDPELAKQWLSERASPRDFGHFTVEISGLIAEKDIDEAFAFVREMRESSTSLFPDGGESINFASATLLEKAAEVSATMFVEGAIFGLVKPSGSSGWPMKFPEGFDYREALSELDRLGEEAGDKFRFKTLPTNLLSDWAEQNPQAAYDWLSTEPQVTFNDDLEEFVEGYSRAASVQEVGTFLSDLANSLDRVDDRRRYDNLLQTVATANNAALASTFVEGLQDSPRRGETLGNLVKQLQFSGSELNAANAILSAMSPNERMGFFNGQEGWRIRINEHWHGRFRAAMRELNHTDAEIDAILGE